MKRKNILPDHIVPAADDDGGHHFARQLSRYNISDAELRAWSARARSFPRAWEEHAGARMRMTFESDGLKAIHERSHGASVLLEIRTALAPASSHHPSFTRLARHRELCHNVSRILGKLSLSQRCRGPRIPGRQRSQCRGSGSGSPRQRRNRRYRQ